MVGSEWVGGSIRSKDPAQILLGEEKARAVRDAIERLEEPGRQAIWLQNFEDWPVVRIAESLGMTVSATKSVLFRARKALLIELKDYFDDTKADGS